MTTPFSEQPLILLADDDVHSARLLRRMLREGGALNIRWLAKPERSLRLLEDSAQKLPADWPLVLIVDLKASSAAGARFIRTAKPLLPNNVIVIAFATSLERDIREALIDAGAAAVFERQADLRAYRQEVAAALSFVDRRLADRGSAFRPADSPVLAAGADDDIAFEFDGDFEVRPATD